MIFQIRGNLILGSSGGNAFCVSGNSISRILRSKFGDEISRRRGFAGVPPGEGDDLFSLLTESVFLMSSCFFPPFCGFCVYLFIFKWLRYYIPQRCSRLFPGFFIL